MILILFIGSIGLLGLFLYFVFSISRETDRKDTKGLTNNQLRLAAWVFAIFLALAAAVIEFFIVLR